MRQDVGKQYGNSMEKRKCRDTGDIMCEKLKELNGKTPEYFLSQTKQNDNIVVDIEKIIQSFGIRLLARTFQDIEEIEKEDVAGLVLLNGDDVGIFYDSEAPLARQRFIVAHELGHCCLHGDSLKAGYIEFLHKNGFEDSHESEASEFAANLLIQKKSLLLIYQQLIFPTVDTLADIFGVPEHLMKFRLEKLGIKYYERKGNRFVES